MMTGHTHKMHAHTDIHTQTYTHTHTHTHIYTNARTHTRIHTQTDTHIDTERHNRYRRTNTENRQSDMSIYVIYLSRWND